MSEQNQTEKPGWWGATLSKLKSALSKTKEAVVDSIVDRSPDPVVYTTDGITAEPRTNSSQEPAAAVTGSTQPYLSEPETAAVTGTAQPYPSEPETAAAGIAYPSTENRGTAAAPDQQTTSRAVADQPRTTSTPTATSVRTPALPPPRAIDEDYLEALEEKLIKADLGLSTAEFLVRDLKKGARAKGWTSHDVESFLKNEFISILKSAPASQLRIEPGKLSIVLIVGVNGTGKTTSIGKLCWRLKQENKKVLVAAADTFRAAAESQLEIWCQRAGVDI